MGYELRSRSSRQTSVAQFPLVGLGKKLLLRHIQAMAIRQRLYNGLKLSLIRRAVIDGYPEPGCQRQLFLHRVVVVGLVVQLPLVAELLTDKVAAVGGCIDKHVARALAQSSL